MSVQSGDRVRVIGDPYTGWEGEVLRAEEQHVTVLIPVFARLTAIELLPSQIEPV